MPKHIKEIERLNQIIKEESARELRLIRMYPPDGGGRAFDARASVRRALARIGELRSSIPQAEWDEKRARDRRAASRKVADYLDKGYSTKEIARKLDLVSIRHLMKDVPGIVFYENWTAVLPKAVADREVLVWTVGDEYSVRYYSMTSTGSHSRLVSSHEVADKRDAISLARKLREDHR